MKKIATLLLVFALLLSALPSKVYANTTEFTNIEIKLNGQLRHCKVISIGSELLFSGEDLAEFGGYDYRIEDSNAFFSRGAKTVRADISTNQLYPFDGIGSYGKKVFSEKIRCIDGTYYFPGTEMLPWLSVTCNEENGVLYIFTDAVSVWDIVPNFQPSDFAFQLTDCCEELGISSKYLKAAAYVHGKGFSGIFWDIIPSLGTYVEYLELFEDMIQDKSSVDPSVDKLLKDGKRVDYWLELAEQVNSDAVFPDEIQVFQAIAGTLTTLSGGIELAMYFTAIREHNENVRNALFSMELNGSLYGFSDEASAALVAIRNEYEDFSSAIVRKISLLGVDFVGEAIKTSTAGLLNVALELLDLSEVTSPGWANGVNRINKYTAISNYCLEIYNSSITSTSLFSIRDIQGSAFAYLYACEQNYRTMAKYAAEHKMPDLEKKYTGIANSAEEWQGQFLSTSSARINDSHEYVEADGTMKGVYTDNLRKMFANVCRYAADFPSELLGEWNLYQPGFPHESGYWSDVPVSSLILNEDGSASVGLGYANSEWILAYNGIWNVQQEDDDTFILQLDMAGGSVEEGGHHEQSHLKLQLSAQLDGNCLILKKESGNDISLYYDTAYERDLTFEEWQTRQGPISNHIEYKTLLKEYPDDAEYTLYDINKDGFDELIIREYEYHYIYTYNGDSASRCGEFCWNYWTECLYAYNENGIIVHDGGLGSLHLEYVYLYTLTNGVFNEPQVLIGTETHSREDVYAYLDKYTLIENFLPVTDHSLLTG